MTHTIQGLRSFSKNLHPVTSVILSWRLPSPTRYLDVFWLQICFTPFELGELQILDNPLGH